jgi:hypothetical protein
VIKNKKIIKLNMKTVSGRIYKKRRDFLEFFKDKIGKDVFFQVLLHRGNIENQIINQIRTRLFINTEKKQSFIYSKIFKFRVRRWTKYLFNWKI